MRSLKNQGPASETALPAEMMGVMYRSGTAGYGKVEYPDYEALFGKDADPNITGWTASLAAYAYNADYLAVKDGDDDTIYKDRFDIVEMTHRYGVYNADTGEDVMKSKSFGFPVYWTTSGGLNQAGLLRCLAGTSSALGQDGQPVAEGTQVAREDFNPDRPRKPIQSERHSAGFCRKGPMLKLLWTISRASPWSCG